MTQTKKTIWISRLLIGGVPLILLLGVYLYQQNSIPLDALSRTIVPPAMGLMVLAKTQIPPKVGCQRMEGTWHLH